MQKSIFLIICGLSVAISSLTFDSSVHCSCDSLTVAECPHYNEESCEVNGSGSQCIAKVTTCSSTSSCYNKVGCTWDSVNKTCLETSSITCSNYTTQDKCLCLWNKSNQCETFSSCENYDKDNCPSNHIYADDSYPGCKLLNSVCTTLVCSDIKTKDDCSGNLSKDTLCAWNDKGVCVELTTDPSCSDYDNFSSFCKNKYGCQYTTSTSTCDKWECSDLKTEDVCKGSVSSNTYCKWSDNKECVELPNSSTCSDLDDFQKFCSDKDSCKYVDGSCEYKVCADFGKTDYCSIAYTSKTEFVLCSRVNETCVELTDTTTLTVDDCRDKTDNNYHWTTDGKCQECATLISEDDFGNIIMGIITIILILS